MWKEAIIGFGAVLAWCFKALIVMVGISFIFTIFGVVLLVIMSDLRVDNNLLSDYEDKEQAEYVRRLNREMEEEENARILRRKLRREQFDQKRYGETRHQQDTDDGLPSESDSKRRLLPGQDQESD